MALMTSFQFVAIRANSAPVDAHFQRLFRLTLIATPSKSPSSATRSLCDVLLMEERFHDFDRCLFLKHVIDVLLLYLMIAFPAFETGNGDTDMCLHSAIIHGPGSLPCLNVCTILQLVAM